MNTMGTIGTMNQGATAAKGSAETAEWLKAAMWVFVAMALMTALSPVMAQVGGATGTATASQTRVVGVVTGWQLIIFAIGAFVLSAAFMYVGYGMAFGGKKWSDIANVVYGALIAGMGPMLVAWLFS